MDRKSETFDAKAQLARQLTHFKKLLFPSSCNLCREPLAAGEPSFCSNCVDQLPYLDQQCIRCAQPLIYSSICPNCQKIPQILGAVSLCLIISHQYVLLLCVLNAILMHLN